MEDQGGIEPMQPMLNPNNLPVINSYKDLINFNNSLPQTSKSLTIEKVAYSKNMITVNGQSFGIERFLYNYLLKPRKLRGKVERLRSYDFSRLALLLEPEAFFGEFQDYINTAVLVGAADCLTLWDFEIGIENNDITITQFNNQEAEEIMIPYFIERIGDSAFFSMPNLRRVFFQEGSLLKSIGKSAFSRCTCLKSISLPTNLKEIRSCAFMNCRALKSIIFNNELEYIGASTFRACLALSKIELPASLIRIGDNAFADCASLTDVVIPDNVEEVGWWSFMKCTKLRSVTIGKGIKTIRGAAFMHCYNLKEMKILGNVEAIERDAFSYTAIEELVLPKRVKYNLYKEAKKILKQINSTEEIYTVLDAVQVTIAVGCDKLKAV